MSNEAPWLLHLDEKTYDEALVAAGAVMMVDSGRSGAAPAGPSAPFSKIWPAPRVAP